MKPRAYTKEEVRDMFLRHVLGMVDYWDGQWGSRPTKKEILSGLAFSILVSLDGGAVTLPGFVVAPMPHPDDKDFHEKRGENWFPETQDIPTDISGSLHDRYCELEREGRKR